MICFVYESTNERRENMKGKSEKMKEIVIMEEEYQENIIHRSKSLENSLTITQNVKNTIPKA